MAFEKATCKVRYYKSAYWGRAGTGKTTTALLVAQGFAESEGKRIAFVCTEQGGPDFLTKKIENRKFHPEPFDFDIIRTRSISRVLTEITALNLNTHGVVILDSISHLWDASIALWKHKNPSKKSIPAHAWGPIKKDYKRLIEILINGKFHVIICGREKDVFGDDGDGGMEFMGVTMKAEKETPHEPNVEIHMLPRQNDGPLLPIRAEVVKDRTSVLKESVYELLGNKGPDYTFDLLGRPHLLTFGEEHATMETVEEGAAEDLEDQRKKSKEAAALSSKIRTDTEIEIDKAKSLGDLETIKTKLQARKDKNEVSENDTIEIRRAFNAKVKELKNA